MANGVRSPGLCRHASRPMWRFVILLGGATAHCRICRTYVQATKSVAQFNGPWSPNHMCRSFMASRNRVPARTPSNAPRRSLSRRGQARRRIVAARFRVSGVAARAQHPPGQWVGANSEGSMSRGRRSTAQQGPRDHLQGERLLGAFEDRENAGVGEVPADSGFLRVAHAAVDLHRFASDPFGRLA